MVHLTATGDEPLPPRPQEQSQPISDQKEQAAPSPPPPAKEPTPPPQDIATEEVQSTDVDEDKEQDSPRYAACNFYFTEICLK